MIQACLFSISAARLKHYMHVAQAAGKCRDGRQEAESGADLYPKAWTALSMMSSICCVCVNTRALCPCCFQCASTCTT